MPLPRRDYFDFLFNGGRGIRQDQIHPPLDAGVPTYIGSSVTQPTDGELQARISGKTDALSVPSIIREILPSDLNRAADALTLTVEGTPTAPLLSRTLQPVAARVLTPSSLLTVLYGLRPGGGTAYVITEDLAPRPQDFDIAVFWSDNDGDPTAVTEDSAVGTFSTPNITVPDYTGSSTRSAYLLIGVPEDAPGITRVRDTNGTGELSMRALSATERASFAGVVGGETYKWARTTSRIRHDNIPAVQTAHRTIFTSYENGFGT